MPLAFIADPDCRLHEMGTAHPESPRRLAAIEDFVIVARLEMAIRRYEAPLATREQLERVHADDYVDAVFSVAPKRRLVWLDPDAAMGPHTLAAALRAAGAAVGAVDLVLGQEASAAFCCIRPPGHHAERRRAMGFCFFNNVAVGAAHALDVHGLERVAVADFDVHHGNGTEDIFRQEPRLLFCSTFQHPRYPFEGAGTDSPRIVNVPLAAGTTGGARISGGGAAQLAAGPGDLSARARAGIGRLRRPRGGRPCPARPDRVGLRMGHRAPAGGGRAPRRGPAGLRSGRRLRAWGAGTQRGRTPQGHVGVRA